MQHTSGRGLVAPFCKPVTDSTFQTTRGYVQAPEVLRAGNGVGTMGPWAEAFAAVAGAPSGRDALVALFRV